jgi:hypothetical protein
MWLGGWDGRTRPAVGVAKPLYARALVLKQGASTRVLVSLDVLVVPGGLRDAVLASVAKFGITADDLLLNASHTHSGPVLADQPDPWIFYGLTPTQLAVVDRYTNWLATATSDAIAAASARAVQPVRLEYGVTHLPMAQDFAINRRDPGAPERAVDGANGLPPTDIPIMWASNVTNGSTIAVVFGYAAHALIYSGFAQELDILGKDSQHRFYQYHPDFPGIAAAQLEADHPNAVALYVAGASGDINPQRLSDSQTDPAALPGTQLATAIESGSKNLRQIIAIESSRHAGVAIPFGAYSLSYYQGLAGRDDIYGRHAQAMLAEAGSGTLPADAPLDLSVWHFHLAGNSELYWIAMSGEPLVHWSNAFKQGALGVPGATWLLGYTNSGCCYLPSDSTIGYPGYETAWEPNSAEPGGLVVTGSGLLYGLPSRLKPGQIDEDILPVIQSLAH